MVFIDILVLIALCWFGFKGFKNGLIYELASILALILGCWIAYHFSDFVATLITGTKLIKPVAFILTFVIVVFLVHIAGRLVEKIVKLVIPDIINNIFGLLFGVCKVLAITSVVLFIIQDIDKKEILLSKEIKEKSIAYQYAEPIIPNALNWGTEPQTEPE